jgi:sensor histidine kinase regulating citrate/malate metabolism
VVLIGIWFILEVGLRNIPNLPSWLRDFQWSWIFGVVIGLVILAVGVNIILKASRRQ